MAPPSQELEPPINPERFKLHARGILTEAEFSAKKAALLGRL
jgi:Short C-terminal domain